MPGYKPVNCSFYDQLEELASRNVRCKIAWVVDNAMEETTGTIKDFISTNGEEFMILDSGLRIRLDQISEINAIKMNGFC